MPPKAAPRSQETDLQEKDTAEGERRQEEFFFFCLVCLFVCKVYSQPMEEEAWEGSSHLLPDHDHIPLSSPS